MWALPLALQLLRLSSNMRTLKFKAQTDKCVFRYRQSNFRRLLPASDYYRVLFRCLNYAQRFDYRALGSSWKLGGAADHLIDGSEKRFCRLSFAFYSPHVIESRSNEKTYLRKLKDMTCFKGATSQFTHLVKTSLVFSSSSFAVVVNLYHP